MVNGEQSIDDIIWHNLVQNRAYRYIPEGLSKEVDELNQQFPIGTIVKWAKKDHGEFDYKFGIIVQNVDCRNIVPHIYVRELGYDGTIFNHIELINIDGTFDTVVYKSSFEEFVKFYISLSEQRIKNARDTIKWSHQSISNEQRYIRKMKKLLKEQTHGECKQQH